jgi:2-polyprenyl-3-methyl-5-hydroxy-6-metoxy-1,4-benzoquinol methylase
MSIFSKKQQAPMVNKIVSEESLTETEIRPDQLMAKQAELFANDIRRIQQYISQFVLIDCPACGSKKFTQRFEKDSFVYVDCADCKTMFMNPRPTPQILEMYYSTSENYAFWNKFIYSTSEEARRNKIFKPRAQRLQEICEHYGVAKNLLLEIGAGFGTFCQEIQERGLFKKVVAVEPTPDLAQACRNKGIETIDQPIERANLSCVDADVIVSFEVIEHLFNPGEFVQSCWRRLRPGGLLVLTCPNIRGFDISVLQKLSNSIDLEHLNYFHPESLAGLISKFGFEIKEVFTPGKLDAELVRKKILSGEFDISDKPFLKSVLIDNWDKIGSSFQEFLVENRLSSHMWVVARKNN